MVIDNNKDVAVNMFVSESPSTTSSVARVRRIASRPRFSARVEARATAEANARGVVQRWRHSPQCIAEV
jgi:hypothetical protein